VVGKSSHGCLLDGEFVLEEVVGDLFSASSSYSLAHCISRDCKLGKGIAKLFRMRFGRVDEIQEQEVGRAISHGR